MNITKTFFIALFCLFAFIARAQDDTVGFWQVQYKGKEISAVNLNNEQSYPLPELTDTNSLFVFYYTESPCRKCLCKLEVRDENANVLKTIERKGYGDMRPFLLQASELKQWLDKGKVYMYFSGKYDGWMPWIFMGALKKATN